jgi:outer membrane receptor protein involved in Fe transport
MRIFFAALVLFLTAHVLRAQEQFTVTGTIQDDQQTPVPFASTVALSQADSAMAAGVVSDETGKFSMDLKPGVYHIKITFLSYEETIIANVDVSQGNIDLGTIVLKTSPKLLEEVEITGQRAQMELQLDKRVFNVSQDITNTGGSAADVLSNIPSVTVDVDGSVSLRGSDNVRILIDGKPSGLTSRNPDALRLLSGNLVERVEVITNPSSRYEAAGEVGIINIILKKNQQKGINGTFTLNGGYPDFYGASYTINVRRRKVNFFSSYGVNYRSNSGYSESYQEYSGTDTSFVYTQDGDRDNSELSHNLSGGADLFLNDFNTITGSLQYNVGDGLNNTINTYNDFENNQLTQTAVRTDREEEDETNIEGSLNYKRTFEQQGRELTLDFKYIRSVDAESSDYTQNVSDGTALIQRADNDAVEKNILFQTDYVHPFSGNDGKAEAGLRSSTRIVDNDYALEQLDENGDWIVFPAFNNNMIYTERIHAGYLMAGNKFGKFSAQAGLRGEYSDITTELTETNEVNHREYFNVFPSANLGYEVKKDKTLQFSYSYRINRPGFRDLLPFSNFSDSRIFFVGNPDLNPEYTHSFETAYLVNWEAGSFLSSAYYRARKGVIQRITEVDESGITRIIPINLASQDAYGLEMNLSLTPLEWWQINTNANLYRAITEGQYEEEKLYSDTYTMNGRITSKMTFWKKVDFQTSFNYTAPRITTQGKQLSTYSLDLALSKDIMKGKGTLIANVRDLLNSRLRRNIIDTEDYYSRSTSLRRYRQFIVTFTYRLNRTKEREKRTDSDSGDREED